MMANAKPAKTSREAMSKMASALVEFFAAEGAETVAEFALDAVVAPTLHAEGIAATCYAWTSDCLDIELAEPQLLPVADWVVGLGVGCSLPRSAEGTFLDNVASTASRGAVLTWGESTGLPNARSTGYVVDEMRKRHFDLDYANTSGFNAAAAETEYILISGFNGRWHCYFEPDTQPRVPPRP